MKDFIPLKTPTFITDSFPWCRHIFEIHRFIFKTNKNFGRLQHQMPRKFLWGNFFFVLKDYWINKPYLPYILTSLTFDKIFVASILYCRIFFVLLKLCVAKGNLQKSWLSYCWRTIYSITVKDKLQVLTLHRLFC